jgi:hypothetical protein
MTATVGPSIAGRFSFLKGRNPKQAATALAINK